MRQKLTCVDKEKNTDRFIQNMKAILGEFQHAFVIADMDEGKIRKVVRKTSTERREITLLKDVKIRKRFEEKVIKSVGIGTPILWGHFKDGVSEACDEVCGMKRGRRSKRDLWWWNEEVVSIKKEAHKAMCKNSNEENMRWY